MTTRFPSQPPPDADGTGGSGLGTELADPIGAMTSSAFDTAMQKVWDAGIGLLRGALTLADDVATITPSSITGNAADDPAGSDPAAAAPGVADTAALDTSALGTSALWPSMVWLAAVIALGLFFYQLISVAVRGGRGMFRAFTGPAQFGVAIALTTGAVAVLLTAADGLTTTFLSSMTEQGDFASILDAPTVAARIGADPDLGDVDEEIRSMVLGLAAFFGTIPAGIGLALLMVFRQAAVLVLIATIPITAAGLVADSTASIFWRSARWILAAVLVKPALALVLLVGVNLMARADGVAGLLAGTTVLLVSLACPVLLFRLLAFVDPGTSAGSAVRSRREWRGLTEPGSDNGTTEAINTARFADARTTLPGSSPLPGSTARASSTQAGAAQGSTTAGGIREFGGTTAPTGTGDGTGALVVPARRPTTKAATTKAGARTSAARRRLGRAVRGDSPREGPATGADQPPLQET